MSQQKQPNTRRAFLTNVGVAAVVAPAIPLTALALTEPVEKADPAFAAVERHKAVWQAYGDAIHDDADFDDPNAPVQITGREEDDAAHALMSVEPTTLAGAIALMNYAVEFVTVIGGQWPEIEHKDGYLDATYAILASVAKGLAKIEGAQS